MAKKNVNTFLIVFPVLIRLVSSRETQYFNKMRKDNVTMLKIK